MLEEGTTVSIITMLTDVITVAVRGLVPDSRMLWTTELAVTLECMNSRCTTRPVNRLSLTHRRERDNQEEKEDTHVKRC